MTDIHWTGNVIWQNFPHWLYWTMSFRKLLVQPVINIWSKFPFQCLAKLFICWYRLLGLTPLLATVTITMYTPYISNTLPTVRDLSRSVMVWKRSVMLPDFIFIFGYLSQNLKRPVNAFMNRQCNLLFINKTFVNKRAKCWIVHWIRAG